MIKLPYQNFEKIEEENNENKFVWTCFVGSSQPPTHGFETFHTF
jgi:hypothetical protein